MIDRGKRTERPSTRSNVCSGRIQYYYTVDEGRYDNDMII